MLYKEGKWKLHSTLVNVNVGLYFSFRNYNSLSKESVPLMQNGDV